MGEMKFWTREEYERFSRELADDPSACCAFELLYWTGVREGELLALTPADLNLRSGAVSISKTLQRINGRDVITEPKTAKSRRRILMPDFLRDELRDYIAARGDLGPDDRLFPISKSFLHRKMRDGSQAAGIQRIRIHDLRHSHVSLLIHMGYKTENLSSSILGKISSANIFAHELSSAFFSRAVSENTLSLKDICWLLFTLNDINLTTLQIYNHYNTIELGGVRLAAYSIFRNFVAMKNLFLHGIHISTLKDLFDKCFVLFAQPGYFRHSIP